MNDSERQIEMFPGEIGPAGETSASASAVPLAPGARQSIDVYTPADADAAPSRLPVRCLRVWPGNPRRHVDPADVATLAASVRASPRGVEMPLAVRAIATPEGEATHDVIDGQMRLLAAREVGLATVPVVVVAVDDAEALEMALRHNHARRDASPLDDAEAIERLFGYGRTIEQIRQRMGARSVRWVERRRSLLRLIPEARRWLSEGLPLGHAEALAALDPAAQTQVVARFATPTGWRDPGTAAAWARELSYALQLLSAAPWELPDASMPGGACTGCPRRSDAQADLFGGAVESAHCLDSACWSGKVEAHWTRAQKAAKRRKLLVIDEPCVDPWSKCGTGETYATLADVPQGVEVKAVALGRDRNGAVYDLVRREDLRAALAQRAAREAQEADDEESEDAAPAAKSPRQIAQEAEREARQARERRWARRLVALAVEPQHIETFEMLALAHLVADYGCEEVLHAAGIEDPEDAHRASPSEALAIAERIPAPQRLSLLLACAAWVRLDPSAGPEELTPAEHAIIALLDVQEPAAPQPVAAAAPFTRLWIASDAWDSLDPSDREDFEQPFGGAEVEWGGAEDWVFADVDAAAAVCIRDFAVRLRLPIYEGHDPPAERLAQAAPPPSKAEKVCHALADALLSPTPAADASPGPTQPPPLTALHLWIAEGQWDGLTPEEIEDLSEPIGGCPVAWEGREGYVTALVDSHAVLVCLRGHAGELGIVLHEGDAPPAPPLVELRVSRSEWQKHRSELQDSSTGLLHKQWLPANEHRVAYLPPGHTAVAKVIDRAKALGLALTVNGKPIAEPVAAAKAAKATKRTRGGAA